MSVAVDRTSSLWPGGIEKTARRAAKAVLRVRLGRDAKKARVAIRLADDAQVRALNRRYRHRDRPTNVLSFPLGEKKALGDLILAWETVAAEATAAGKPLAHHVSHLVAHGVLHLLGMDHERSPREARRQERWERRILAGLGVPDPY